MSLNDELEMARLETCAKFPALEVVVQDGSVYVNFEWSEAVTITPEFTDDGRVWFAEAVRWDQTHGVEDEVPIDNRTSLTGVLERVDAWLRVRAEQDAKTQAIFDSMPED